MNPIQELKTFLAGIIPGLRARRQYGDVLHIEVAQEIVADAEAERKRFAGLAYTAEQADHEAAKLIGVITADGHLTDDELTLLRRALANINRSAGHDHRISEALSA